MSNQLFTWDFDGLIQMCSTEYLTEAVTEWHQNIESQINKFKHWSLEELEEEFTRSQDNREFLYAYAIILSARKPGIARNLFVRAWGIYYEFFLMTAALIRYSYPEAYSLMTHVLQYGPFPGWDCEVAYQPPLDTFIESELVKLEDSHYNYQLNQYMQKFPNCGMLKAIRALKLLYGIKCSMESGEDTFPGENISEICYLLTQACKQGIPPKYGYFVTSYLCLWRFSYQNFNFKHRFQGPMDPSRSVFTWFLSFVLWELAPNSFIQGTLLTDCTACLGGEENASRIRNRIQFGPRLTITEAYQEFEKWANFEEGSRTFVGCLVCISVAVLVLLCMVAFIVGG